MVERLGKLDGETDGPEVGMLAVELLHSDHLGIGLLDTLVVSIRFDSADRLGVAIMAIAGALLFGGAFVSIRALLRSQDRAPP